MSKNFEKEYKESISRATKILGNCDEPIDTNVKEAIEAIFPTLKKDKTDDQKWEILKSMIHSNVPDNIYSFYRLSRKDFEAWLDDKSKEISVLKDQIESLTAALKLFRESKHEPVVSEEVINEGIAHFGITQYQIDNWLKKHFNVVRDPCKDCKSPMLNCHNFPCVKKKAFKQSESIFEVIRREQFDEQVEKQDEMKLTWSREDDRVVDLIVNIFRANHSNDYFKANPIGTINMETISSSEIIDWLNSLKDRMQPQSKQEWSEEEEDAIGMAIIALDDMYDPDSPNTTYTGYSMPFNTAAKRLKSLRPKLRWKPSEEQLIALNNAVLLNEDHYNGAVLSTLLEQLKKL